MIPTTIQSTYDTLQSLVEECPQLYIENVMFNNWKLRIISSTYYLYIDDNIDDYYVRIFNYLDDDNVFHICKREYLKEEIKELLHDTLRDIALIDKIDLYDYSIL